MQNLFEISRKGKTTITPMEGLRGFAVFLVFLVHYGILAEPWLIKDAFTLSIAKNAWNIGRSGVDLFFVLSGFLIYGSLVNKKVNLLYYAKRRMQRIYPAFLAVFLLYLIFIFLIPNVSKLPSGFYEASKYILQNLLFLPGIFAIEPIIAVAWSLSYEVLFYLLMPLFIIVFSLRKFSNVSRIIFFTFIATCGCAYFLFFDGHIRLLMFLSGVILYDFLQTDFSKKLNFLGLISLFIALVSIVIIFEENLNRWWHYVIIFVSYFLLCLDCFSHEGIAAKIFSFTPLRWFGNMSYSYFLIHGITINGLFLILRKINLPISAYSFWILLIPVFILTLIPAIILFAFVEKPLSLRRKV